MARWCGARAASKDMSTSSKSKAQPGPSPPIVEEEEDSTEAKNKEEFSGESYGTEALEEGEIGRAEADDLYFDDLAKQRWKQRGHGSKPEPPTVVWRHPSTGAAIIISGLPAERDKAPFTMRKVAMVVSCFNKESDCVEARGGYCHPDVVRFRLPTSPGEDRDLQWGRIWRTLQANLASREGTVFHCMAGCHRVAVGGATAV